MCELRGSGVIATVEPSRLAEVVGEKFLGLRYIVEGRSFVQTDVVPQRTCQAEHDITVRSEVFPRLGNSLPHK